jgi:hypothetical protein
VTYKVDLENVRGLIETKTGPFDVVKQVSDGLNLEVSVTVRARLRIDVARPSAQMPIAGPVVEVP